MSTMLYRYNPKGETIVQVDSPTDYHNFDVLITSNIGTALNEGWFLTAKEAQNAYQSVSEIVDDKPLPIEKTQEVIVKPKGKSRKNV
jgi:hypothetical protein